MLPFLVHLLMITFPFGLYVMKQGHHLPHHHYGGISSGVTTWKVRLKPLWLAIPGW